MALDPRVRRLKYLLRGGHLSFTIVKGEMRLAYEDSKEYVVLTSENVEGLIRALELNKLYER